MRSVDVDVHTHTTHRDRSVAVHTTDLGSVIEYDCGTWVQDAGDMDDDEALDIEHGGTGDAAIQPEDERWKSVDREFQRMLAAFEAAELTHAAGLLPQQRTS